MHPVIYDFEFFGLLKEPLSLHSYGLLIAAGFLTALVIGKRHAAREGEDPERIVDLSFYLLLSGLVGARFVFVLTKLDEYLRNPVEILLFWKGGLVWYGAFIAAGLFVVYYTRRHRMNFFKMADIIIPNVALAHAFGRFGCVAAGCCFGEPTGDGWGLVFPEGSMAHAAHQREGLVSLGDPAVPVHPTQLYEAGFEIAMFWVLTLLRPHKRFHGQLLLIWLATYPIARSIIEMYRGDSERGVWAFGLSTSQYISIAVAGVAVWVFFYLRRARLKAIEASA